MQGFDDPVVLVEERIWSAASIPEASITGRGPSPKAKQADGTAFGAGSLRPELPGAAGPAFEQNRIARRVLGGGNSGEGAPCGGFGSAGGIVGAGGEVDIEIACSCREGQQQVQSEEWHRFD